MAYNKDDCKNVFLLHKTSLNDNIRDKSELMRMLRLSGRHPVADVISRYWKSDMKEINYNIYQDICKDLPVITKSELSKYLRKLDSKSLGYLDKQDFFNYLTKNCSEVSKRDLSEIIDKCDRNGDDRLLFDEIAAVLLSNLEPFRRYAREKVESGEPPIPKRRETLRPGTSSSTRSTRDYDDLDEVDDNGSIYSRKNTDLTEKLIIEKLIEAKFTFKEPRKFNTWTKFEMRGGLFINDDIPVSGATSINMNIKSTTYSFMLKEPTNVIITMAPLSIISKLDTQNLADMAFIIHGPDLNFLAVSLAIDANGSVYYEGKLLPGKYRLIPFTSGAKLRQEEEDEGDEDLKAFQNTNRDAPPSISNEFRSVLEDIFRMCDIDGNGFLSKDEYKIYFELTVEDEWEDFIWKELGEQYEFTKTGEISFKTFLKIVLDDYKDQRYEVSVLVDIIEGFGFNSKMQLKESLPFLLTFNLESNVEFTPRCQGLLNESKQIIDLLISYVCEKGEVVQNRSKIRECNFYMNNSGGRLLLAVENTNSISDKNPLRLEIDISKSKNMTFFNENKVHKFSISSSSRKLILFGIAEEPKVAMLFNASISKV